MHPGRLLLVQLVGLTLAVGALAAVPGAARAAAGEEVRLSATAGYADAPVALTATATDAEGAPLAGVPVTFERRVRGSWTAFATVATDASGVATAEAARARTSRENRFRARAAGATSEVVESRLRRRASVVTVGGAGTVVDERQARLQVRWRTAGGVPVTGQVRLLQRRADGSWRKVRTLRTDERGRASLTVRPRVDTRWRAQVRATDWVAADRSPVHLLDNLPPGRPVRLPKAAPSPRVKVPAQPRARGAGANPVVTGIPDGVWRSMTGRSWHAGCPVGRSGLRLLRINYWGFDGYRYRGEVVAAAGAIGNMSRALADMYRREFPIRSMYRVDRFGWSSRLGGADDYRSMAADNTSAFNCRDVVGKPGVRSPHSYGRSLDVNPWENPYRSRTGVVPNAWWPSRSHALVAWRSRSHGVVRIMTANGLRWTYGHGDLHHFDVAGGAGRVPVLPPACRVEVCH